LALVAWPSKKTAAARVRAIIQTTTQVTRRIRRFDEHLYLTISLNEGDSLARYAYGRNTDSGKYEAKVSGTVSTPNSVTGKAFLL